MAPATVGETAELLEDSGEAGPVFAFAEGALYEVENLGDDVRCRIAEAIETADLEAMRESLDRVLLRVARRSSRCLFLGFGLLAHGLAWLNGVDVFDPLISDQLVAVVQSVSPFV